MQREMFPAIPQASIVRRALALAAVLAAVVALAGCAWTGEGREVGEALEKASDVKAAEFTATADFSVSGLPEGASSGAESMKMTMRGASDETDPARPRSWFEIDVPSMMSMKVIEPGDGYGYIEMGGKVLGMPVDSSKAEVTQDGMSKVFDVLAKSIGGFKRAGDSTSADGETLKTVYATADAKKLCGEVLPAVMDVAKTAASSSGSLQGFTGGGGLASSCAKMLSGDPQLWFGIDASGMLRMVTLKVDVGMAGSPVKMSASMRVDFNPVASIPAIEAPAGAKIFNSQDELAREITKSISLGSGFTPQAAE